MVCVVEIWHQLTPIDNTYLDGPRTVTLTVSTTSSDLTFANTPLGPATQTITVLDDELDVYSLSLALGPSTGSTSVSAFFVGTTTFPNPAPNVTCVFGYGPSLPRRCLLWGFTGTLI